MKNMIKKFVTLAITATLIVPFFFSQSLLAEAAPKKNAKTTPKNDVIIVIDPGHDNVHHGCQYAGLDEGNLDFIISYYLVKELQSYDGVQVYMTRLTTGCAYGGDPNSAASCLAGRVNFAKSLNANAYISIHNDYDSDNDPTVNGCKVIYQNLNYRKDLAVNGYKLGASVLGELTKTGLNINNWKMDPNGTGLVTRNSSNGTYPDGSVKDYYAVLNQTKTAGITGIIIEHAYMSNTSDRANHLSTPEQLQQLGVADATAIAKYYGLSKKVTK